MRKTGKDLVTKEGRVTSHLFGIINLISKLISLKITPIFVFDGKPPALKKDTLKKLTFENIANFFLKNFFQGLVIIGPIGLTIFVIWYVVTSIDNIIPSVAKEIPGLVFISTILWTFQGLPNIGNLAAEVQNPRKSFPITMSALILLMVLTYGTAVALGVALQPDLTQWQEGYFSTLLATISPWLGVFITLGSTIAMLSGGLTSTAVYSRFIAAAAKEGYIPFPLLGQQNMTQFKTPVPAILLLSCTTFALTNLNFTSLLAVDTTLNVISIVLVVISVSIIMISLIYLFMKVCMYVCMY
jgi:amino acid transporter